MEDLRAKSAADIRRHHPELVFGKSEDKGAHQQTDDMRVLRSGVEGRFIGGGIVVANRHPRLHRIRYQAIIDQLEGGHVMSALDCLINRLPVFLHEPPVIAEIGIDIVMHQRTTVQCRLHVDDRRQLLDVANDLLGRIAGLRCRFRHRRRDRIADMPNLALGQDRMSRLLHRLTMPVRHLPATGKPADTLEIRAGKHPEHARHRGCCLRIHGFQDPVRHFRAQETGMGLTMNVDVICVSSVSGQKTDILTAFRTGADTEILWHFLLL